MGKYVVRRLLQALLVIVIVIVVVFFVTHMLGDPVSIVLPSTATPENIAAVRAQLHLDDSLLMQFVGFMRDAMTGSFGDSFWQHRPAMGIVLERMPATFMLAMTIIAIILPVGIGLGIIGALMPQSPVDKLVSVLSFLSVSFVDFWLALMLILVFAVNLGWFPTSGYGDAAHIVLPAVTVALLHVGTLAQVVRSGVAEEMDKNYIAAARSRGLPESRIIFNHGLRNAMVPVMTIVGTDAALLLNGTVIAEVVFAWPGVGHLLIQSIQQRDLPLIVACVFVAAVIVTIVNLLVDLLYRYVNPRLRVAT